MNDDQPLLLSPRCDRERCSPRSACVPCRKERGDALTELVRLTEAAGGYDDELEAVRAAGFEVLAWTPDEDLGKPIVLDAESFEELKRRLENPPEPSEALRELMRAETPLARCANHNLTECPTCGTYYVIGANKLRCNKWCFSCGVFLGRVSIDVLLCEACT